MHTREDIIKAVSDIFPPGGWVFISCTDEYDWVPEVVNEFVKIKNELDYDEGEPPPEENSRIFGDIRVSSSSRFLPGYAKVFVLGGVTDKTAQPEKLAITDHYFTWLSTESAVELFLFFGKIDGELAAIINSFPDNASMFFVDIEEQDIVKHFPQLRNARPDLADPPFLSPGWISSYRNIYKYYSCSTISTLPKQPRPPTPQPIPVGGSQPEPAAVKPPEPEETPGERRMRKRALRYDEKYRQ